MKCNQCSRKFNKNKHSLTAVINNKGLDFCSDKCYARYCFTNKYKCDVNKLRYHKPQGSIYFNHVSYYNSFSDFKQAIMNFLKKNSFNDLLEDSFNFACHMNFQDENKTMQYKAINTALSQIYGKDNVRWGYINPLDNSDFFWGPYIVIDEETYFYYPKIKISLDKFIRGKLKNGKW